MNIIVTGGAGFIGSHLVDRLVQEGNQVAVIDNLSTGKRKNVNRSARLYKLDVRSSRLDRVFRKERPTLVIHFAAQMNVRRSTEDPTFDADINILGTINLMEHAVRHGVRKVVFASSGGAVYGEQDFFPAPETHPIRPVSPYGVSKITGEYYLHYYHHVAGIRCVALRFANVYGPRQDSQGEAGVVAIFTEKMLKGAEPLINGNGNQTRDFIYVDDVVEATLVTMAPEVEGVFNVGTGQETTINEIFRSLKEITKATCKETHGPAKKGEQARSVLDTTRLRETFGWEPTIKLTVGLEHTVQFFKG